MRTLVAGEGWLYDKQFTSTAREKRTLFVGPAAPSTDDAVDKSYFLNYWSHCGSPAEAFEDLTKWQLEEELINKVVLCSSPSDWEVDITLFPSNSALLHSLVRVTQFVGVVVCLEYLKMLAPAVVVEVNCSFGSSVPDQIAKTTIFHVYSMALSTLDHILRINNIPQLQEMAKELNNG